MTSTTMATIVYDNFTSLIPNFRFLAQAYPESPHPLPTPDEKSLPPIGLTQEIGDTFVCNCCEHLNSDNCFSIYCKKWYYSIDKILYKYFL